MPAMWGSGPLSEPSRTFEVVEPRKTLGFQDIGGMPNSCAVSCHGLEVNAFGLGLDPHPDDRVWNDQFDCYLAERLVVYYDGPKVRGGMIPKTALETAGSPQSETTVGDSSPQGPTASVDKTRFSLHR